MLKIQKLKAGTAPLKTRFQDEQAQINYIEVDVDEREKIAEEKNKYC
jgi:hypothetical protein